MLLEAAAIVGAGRESVALTVSEAMLLDEDEAVEDDEDCWYTDPLLLRLSVSPSPHESIKLLQVMGTL